MEVKNNITTRKLNNMLEALTDEQLYDTFRFYFSINKSGALITTDEKFNVCLETFEKNPFRKSFDLAHRKQLIGNLITYTDDVISLMRAIELIQKNLTMEEILSNFYESISFGEEYPFEV